jgi:hypothetical protein
VQYVKRVGVRSENILARATELYYTPRTQTIKQILEHLMRLGVMVIQGPPQVGQVGCRADVAGLLDPFSERCRWLPCFDRGPVGNHSI